MKNYLVVNLTITFATELYIFKWVKKGPIKKDPVEAKLVLNNIDREIC